MSRRINLARLFQPPQTCGGKRCFTSEQEARAAALAQELLQPDLILSVYKCTAGCKSWHLTRQKDKWPL